MPLETECYNFFRVYRRQNATTLTGNPVVKLHHNAINLQINAANNKISASDDAEHTVWLKSLVYAVALRNASRRSALLRATAQIPFLSQIV